MANIVKKESSLPEPIRALIAGIEPAPLVKNVGAFGVGFVAAPLGGKLAKQIDAVERFAAGGTIQEIVVDTVAGLVLDGVALVGVHFATAKEQGLEMTLKVAKLMVAGTVIGALATNLAQLLAESIDKVVEFIVGIFGKTSKGGEASAQVTSSSSAPALPPAGGASSYYARAAGGSLYAMNAGM